ncbi:MAG: hypothetical protein ACRBCI_13460 [Cellvibrionaceae bacterium]
MIEQIEQWIDQQLVNYSEQRVSCLGLPESVRGFFSDDFLSNAYFVETKDIPKPYFTKGIPGAVDFLSMQAQGITYKNTYFLLPDSPLSTHLHELVHVTQWHLLGGVGFIQAYIAGVQQYGYRDSPLEEMAYSIQAHFESEGEFFHIPSHIEQLMAQKTTTEFLKSNKIALS